MTRIIVLGCVEMAGVFPFKYFSGGILDRVKGYVVTVNSRSQTVDRGRNCVVGPSILGVF